MKNAFLGAIVVLIWQTAFAQNEKTPNQPIVDQLNLTAQLNFDTIHGKVMGTAELTLRCTANKLDSFHIDAVNFEVEELNLTQAKKFKTHQSMRKISFKNISGIKNGDTFKVQIKYSARPHRGLFFVGWDDATGEAPRQIWSQGQGIDNRHWLPLIDDQKDKLTTQLTIDFAAKYQVISNGAQLQKEPLENGLMRWQFIMEKPHSPYLIMLAIGQYNFIQQRSLNGLVLKNYYYPNWENRNEHTYFKNKEVFNFLQQEIGFDYPWEDYEQVPVMNFQHGAMENTSATIFGDFFCVDERSFNDRNYVAVNAHELAHQWFGNLVTSPNSTHHWLHEGFASYYAWHATGHIFGKEAEQISRLKSFEIVKAAESVDDEPLMSGKAGSARFYDKGAWLVHMLRQQVGEEAWHAAIEKYLSENAFGIATTTDLQRAFEKASGQDLQWFFDQWVRQSGMPEIHFTAQPENKTLHLKFEQKLRPNEVPFQLHIPIKVVTTKRTISLSLNMKNKLGKTSFQIPNGEEVVAVFPDPDFNILAIWHINAPIKYLENMSANKNFAWPASLASWVNHNDYDAKMASKMNAAHVLHRINFAAQLAQKASKLSDEEMNFLAAEENLEVIKTFAKSAQNVPDEMKETYLKWAAMPSYELNEWALANGAMSNIKWIPDLLAATENSIGTVGCNVRITWLTIYELTNEEESKMDELLKYSSAQFDFLTRINAFKALQTLQFVSAESVQNAMNGLFQNNRKLRNSAKIYLKWAAEDKKNKKEIELWLAQNEPNLADWQRKRIEYTFDK